MSSENWRTAPDDAAVFLTHQKKRLELESRKPVIRRAADLVGPGIGKSAVRVTNWNDLLATYNGYFSAAAGATGAPAADEAFIGFTLMDDALGGTQMLTGLSSGKEWKRIFLRNPSDPSSISFGAWTWMNEPVAVPPATPAFVPEMAYLERTTNSANTNTNVFSTSTAHNVGSLRANVVGEGKRVKISFECNVSNSVANNVIYFWFNNNDQNISNPGGQVGLVGLGLANSARRFYMSRRVLLTAGVSYSFTVGFAGLNAGTTTVVCTTEQVAYLAVDRLT